MEEDSGFVFTQSENIKQTAPPELIDSFGHSVRQFSLNDMRKIITEAATYPQIVTAML